MIPESLLTLIVTVVLFLLGQLLANIVFLGKLNTRVTRVETHLIHIMHIVGHANDETKPTTK